MGKPPDRRIQKTRKLLSEALISLIIEKGYDAVTVQDILDRANVGRSTFYAHFENKEHLLLSGQGDFQKLLVHPDRDAKGDSPGPAINFLWLFEHIAENHKLAMAMMVDQRERLATDFFRDVIALKMADYLKQQHHFDAEFIDYHANAAAAAMISLVSDWLAKGLKHSPAQMADIAQNLCDKMLAAI